MSPVHNEKRILFAEDDLISAKLLIHSLVSLGFQVTHVENGRQAIEAYNLNPYPIVLTDYDMPEMNGSQLIDFLKEGEEEPLIIVLTSHSESSLIIEIMKKGIHDYITKPIETEELALKLNRAFEMHSMKRLDRITKRERELRLEGHLDWVQWKERSGGTGKLKNINQTLFESLKTSFNQGAGFGALVTLLKMISDFSTREGDFFKIEASFMELIQTNTEMAEKALDTFSEIETILNGNIDLERVSVGVIYEDCKNILVVLSKMANIKKQTIFLSEKKATFDSFDVNIHRNLLKNTITEILTNACKFSVAETAIHILIYIESGNLVIAVYNTPVATADRIEGIPLPYENLVFEPFYRLTRFVYDEYKTLDFGLGLTKADAVIKRFQGKIEIKNIIDHLNLKEKPTTKVICKVSLPILAS